MLKNNQCKHTDFRIEKSHRTKISPSFNESWDEIYVICNICGDAQELTKKEEILKNSAEKLTLTVLLSMLPILILTWTISYSLSLNPQIATTVTGLTIGGGLLLIVIATAST